MSDDEFGKGTGKCTKPECTKRAVIFISRRDPQKNEHLYCSVSCVQNDSARRESATTYVKMAKSSVVVPGEMSPSMQNIENMTTKEKNVITSEKEIMNTKRDTMQKTLIDYEINNEETETPTLKSIANEKDSISPLRAPSSELLPITEAEEYRQENLIESSIRSTHELAKHTMKQVMEKKEVDPAAVNAACNAVKQVHSLLRLRLDIHKVLRGR